jgi:hypothetical protein
MDLLERYLQSVRFFLPRRQQDDIVRELSENLIAQMDDRQEMLGRPLNEDEQADILRRHGHPLLVAGRYLSHQHLIGPPFFPMYLFALKLGLGSALLVTIVLAALRAMVSEDPVRQVVDGFLAFPGRGLMVFAWTTLGFAALDLARSRLKLAHQWDPRSLPRMIRHKDRISHAHSAGELVMAAACVVVLLLLPQTPSLLLGPAAAFLDLAPVWRTVYVPILLLTVAAAALSVVNLARPYWTPARSATRLAIHGVSFVVCAVLLRSNVWVVARTGGALPDGAPADRVVEVVNASVEIGLFVASVVILFEVGREGYRLRSRRRSALRSDSAPAGAGR